MKKTLASSLYPVEVDGFLVSLGNSPLTVRISYNGRWTEHVFFWKDDLKTAQDYESMMREAFLDFRNSAIIGCGGKRQYREKYCEGISELEVDEAWKDYRKSSLAFKALTGVNAIGFK